ncbi:MAG: hypothetical protein AUI53_05270 [Acidobacteria bacterium 13_1_40CM_2_60_7]|nr:MAG: hypothetical protein AUH88_04485 [Acidobacteria bacterium 13_1_40CM_4_61_5]OLD61562.1 MAG: hypothetical protein AUI53_05270 [Acidobacteria bacterium 13_1_40CM_2_60_7]OLE84892.1 MAG: hypothetical protein AUG07_05680 [Acidobacteria bacterium 13_1_20CM_2_60_10]PYU06326.1 MAG: hypothetical protein DMG33_08250 [Acidobacteriota bacterium]
MGLHEQACSVLIEPTAAIAIANIHEVQGTIEFGAPTAGFNARGAGVNQNQAAGPEQGFHPVVFHADESVSVVAVAVGQSAFETSPALNHAREELRAAWIERRVKAQRNMQRSRGRNKVCFRGRQRGAVAEELVERHVVPSAQFERVEVINGCERINLMETGNDAVVFNIREPADMKNKLRPAAARGQFITGAFDVAVGQAKTFTSLAKAKTRDHLPPQGVTTASIAAYTRRLGLLKIRNKTRTLVPKVSSGQVSDPCANLAV